MSRALVFTNRPGSWDVEIHISRLFYVYEI